MKLSIDYPRTIFIEISTECNSHCKYCHMWMTIEKEGVLTTKEKIRIIENFQKLNPKGEVVLTGGETMIKYNEFFALTKKCLDLDLTCAANTNASFINNTNYEKVLKEGPKYLVISLDSHLENIHEYTRGIKGSYKHTLTVLKNLVKLKKQKKYNTEIITNSVIFDENIEYLEEFVKFAENIGIDGVLFQMLSRTFYKKNKEDIFFNNHQFKNKIKAIKSMQGIIDVIQAHPIIRTSRQDFEWMKLYINNSNFIGEQICESYKNNLIIDSYGEIKLCFDMKKINDGKPSIGNIRDYKNIEEIWTSREADSIRKIMENCRLNCGLLNCHRKK